jgi:hypothetical protein
MQLMRQVAWTGLILGVACSRGANDGDDGRVADAAVQIDAATPDAALAAACLGSVLPGPEHRQYVIDFVGVPTSAVDAQQYGIDLDGDPANRPDNALGQILSTLVGQADAPVQEAMDGAIADGTILHLLDLDTSALEVRLLIGKDCDAVPNPLDNFSGSELFHVREDDPGNPPLPASLLTNDLTAGPGVVTLQLIILNGPPIRLPLHGARIEGVFAVDGVTGAKLGGAVIEADVDSLVVPALADSLQTTVAADCAGAPPTCCSAGSTGESLVELFDADGDCAITLDEVRTNDLIASLLSPDVDLFDSEGNFNPRVDEIKDSLSLGVGLLAVPARFPLPN